MVTKDCYVERAMERLTVTTMRLCSDLLKMDLQEKPAPAGFSMCGGLMARVAWLGLGFGPLAPVVPRDFLCAIIGLSGRKCALPGCIAGVLMGQRDRLARPFLAPNSQSPGFGLRNDILCGFGAGVAGEDIGVLLGLLENGGSHDLCCTTPCDVRVHISL